MNGVAYILYSKKPDRFYIGATTTSAIERLQKHNQSTYGKHFTSQSADWQIMVEINCEDFSQAREIELFIKRMKSRKFIEKLIGNPDQIERLIQSAG